MVVVVVVVVVTGGILPPFQSFIYTEIKSRRGAARFAGRVKFSRVAPPRRQLAAPTPWRYR
jgi:hypothetical protein